MKDFPYKMPIQFSKYFTHKELQIDGQYVPNLVLRNMFEVVKFGLGPIRDKFGPTKITSGYRDPMKNVQVGGSLTSQHVYGEAVDFVCLKAKGRDVFDWLKKWWPGQLFYYSQRGHCHIGLPKLRLHDRLWHRIIND